MATELARSSVSVKTETESFYAGQTADEGENSGDEMHSAAEQESEVPGVAGDDSEDDVVLVASDLVPPASATADAAMESARQSPGSREAEDRHDESLNPESNAKPRCEICKKQKQKCTFVNPSGRCDKCYKQGYECHIVDTVNSRVRTRNRKKSKTKRSRGIRHVSKCDWCRRNNRTCLPENRVWPAKCAICESNGYPCSPPEIGIRAKAQSHANHTSGLLVPMSSPPDDDAALSSGSDASIPAVMPPLKRKRRARTSNGIGADASGHAPVGESPHVDIVTANQDSEAANLRDTIAQMEEEYQEVLRSVQAAHAQELGALKAKLERAEVDLATASKNHERRLDDLIYIMKNNERRADEIIQSLKNR